jgi:glycyl-tRNA synthetase (class II)
MLRERGYQGSASHLRHRVALLRPRPPAEAYLRPETAQGIFVNFLNVQQSTRQKVPFGIAQIGKAFRNEITPGNFIFRTREFEQMEMQFFVQPGEDVRWFEHWKARRMEYYAKLGVRPEKLRFHHRGPKPRSHQPLPLQHRLQLCRYQLGLLALRAREQLGLHV